VGSTTPGPVLIASAPGTTSYRVMSTVLGRCMSMQPKSWTCGWKPGSLFRRGPIAKTPAAVCHRKHRAPQAEPPSKQLNGDPVDDVGRCRALHSIQTCALPQTPPTRPKLRVVEPLILGWPCGPHAASALRSVAKILGVLVRDVRDNVLSRYGEGFGRVACGRIKEQSCGQGRSSTRLPVGVSAGALRGGPKVNTSNGQSVSLPDAAITAIEDG